MAQSPGTSEVPQNLRVGVAIGKELAPFVPPCVIVLAPPWVIVLAAGRRALKVFSHQAPTLSPWPAFVSGGAHACFFSFWLFQVMLWGTEVQPWPPVARLSSVSLTTSILRWGGGAHYTG